jgi:hypothetical protein
LHTFFLKSDLFKRYTSKKNFTNKELEDIAYHQRHISIVTFLLNHTDIKTLNVEPLTANSFLIGMSTEEMICDHIDLFVFFIKRSLDLGKNEELGHSYDRLKKKKNNNRTTVSLRLLARRVDSSLIFEATSDYFCELSSTLNESLLPDITKIILLYI